MLHLFKQSPPSGNRIRSSAPIAPRATTYTYQFPQAAYVSSTKYSFSSFTTAAMLGLSSDASSLVLDTFWSARTLLVENDCYAHSNVIRMLGEGNTVR
jgi:hypothetical protein